MRFPIIVALLPTFLLSVGANAFLPKSFRAEYKQTIKKVVSGREQETLGTINYLYPSKIRFEQKRPERIVWVSNSKKSWFYQAPFIKGEPGQLKVIEGGKNVVGDLFDLLKGGLSSNKHYKVSRNKKRVTIKFNPKTKRELEIARARLLFKNQEAFKEIDSMEIFQADGKVIRLKFTNIEVDLKYSSKLFVFTPPENTKVVY